MTGQALKQTEQVVTVDSIRASIAAMVARAGLRDGPFCHQDEDSLHQSVLRFIATANPTNAAELAAEALKTLDLEFDRWFE